MTHASWPRARAVIGTITVAIASILFSTAAPAADLRDHTEGKVLARGAPIHGANGIIFDRHDRLFIASFLGKEILIMDPRSGAILERLGLPKIDVGTPDDLIFGPDGSLYWTSPVIGEVNRLSPAGVWTRQFVGPGVNPITFSDDGRLFVSECFIGDVLFEVDPNLVAPPRVIRSDLGPGCGLNGMDWFGGFLYGPRMFAGEVVRVNVDSGEVTTVASGFGTPGAVKFDSHGRLHVTDSQSGQVVRINTENGGKTVIAQLTPGLDNLAFDSQDRLFVSGDLDGFIVQVLPDGRTRKLSKGGMISPGGVAVLPGPRGRETVFVADAFSLRAFDGRTGRLESSTPGVFPVPPLKGPFTVSSDGHHWSSPHRLVVSSYFDNTVQLWDPTTREILEQYSDFAVPMNAIRFRGDLIVAELGTGSVVRRSTATGERTTLATGLHVPSGLAATDWDVWVADWDTGIVWKIVAGGVTVPAPIAVARGLLGPEGLAVDRDDSLLVVESKAGRLSRIDLATGTLSTVADNLALGAAAPAGLPGTYIFNGVAVGQSGTIYVTGDLADVLYRLVPNKEGHNK